MRSDNRQADQLRNIELIRNYAKHAEGSCFIKCGDTHVLCTATVEDRIPAWLKGKGKGWITAEYGMLPRSTNSRMDREAARGKQSGRTQEIQRLIGRAIRSVVDLTKMPDMQIRIDCDVIQADGGTRTASITGAYIALADAISHLLSIGALTQNPIVEPVAAISCGVVNDMAVVDLNYEEDSSAIVDANFVMTASGKLIEIQATGEEHPFTDEQFQSLMKLARSGIGEIIKMQQTALKG